MSKFDIYERVTSFAVRTIHFSEKLSHSFSGKIVAKQLIRSSTSIGANLQEADGAVSKNDFLNKLGTSRKESLETQYWLDIIKRSNLIKNPKNLEELDFLCCESKEISKIICSIIINTKKNNS